MRKPSLYDPNIAISREIDSSYDNVKLVADNLPTIISVNDAIEAGTFDNINDILSEPLRSNINTLGPIADDISSVVGIASDITAVSSQILAVSAVSDNMDAITTVAGSLIIINEVNDNIADIITVSNNIGSVGTVSSNIGSVNNVNTNIAAITNVNTNISDIQDANANMPTFQAVTTDPLRQSILDAEGNATAAQLRAWEAEAEKMTSDSYATEPEDVFVKLWSSDGDGTFSFVNSTEYSALHYKEKAQTIVGSDVMLDTTYDTNTNGIVDNSEKLTDFKKHGIGNGGLVITVDGGNTSVINIAAGNYYIDGTEYQYAGGSFETDPTFGAGDFGTLGINSSGTIVSKINDFFTEGELQAGILELTAFAKFTVDTVDVIAESQFKVQDFIKNMMIRAKAFEGTRFNGTAGLISENGTTAGRLDVAQGYINTPNAEVKQILAATEIGGALNYRVSGAYELISQDPFQVNTTQYDDGTDLVNIPVATHYAVHTLARSSRTGGYYLVIGTTVYTSEGDALTAPYSVGQFSSNEATSEIEPLANIIVRPDTGIVSIVDLRNNASSVTSSVLSNLNLQSTYDLSSLPQIQLADGSPLEIRNDASDNNNTIQKWTDSTGTTIAEVTKTGIPRAGVIGIENVDNTSDANKPVSTAQETRIQAAEGFSIAVAVALG